MPADPLRSARPGGRSLSGLLDDLQAARGELGKMRAGPASPDRLVAAHASLLQAMEHYAAALTARGLPTPWRLRDDLRLERCIDGRNSGPRR
jgi:hypothetical protein